MQIYVGTSGWSYEHWSKRFYPKNLPKTKWLDFYVQNFNTVEMNMSFYRFPTREMIKNWKKKLPKNFLMTVKANREITHIKRFKGSKQYLEDFYTAIEDLKNSLGCVLFQAPAFFKFTPEHFERVKKFLNKIERSRRNVFEFRHESWWNQEVFDFFKKENLIFASVDGFGMPKDLIETSQTIYLRMHGKKAYASLYNKKELKYWADKIKNSRGKECFCYFNNDNKAYAVKNARELYALLNWPSK